MSKIEPTMDELMRDALGEVIEKLTRLQAQLKENKMKGNLVPFPTVTHRNDMTEFVIANRYKVFAHREYNQYVYDGKKFTEEELLEYLHEIYGLSYPGAKYYKTS